MILAVSIIVPLVAGEYREQSTNYIVIAIVMIAVTKLMFGYMIRKVVDMIDRFPDGVVDNSVFLRVANICYWHRNMYALGSVVYLVFGFLVQQYGKLLSSLL